MQQKVIKHRFNEQSKKLDIFDGGQTEERGAIGKLLQRAKDSKLEYIRKDGTYHEMKIFVELCVSSVISYESWSLNCTRISLSNFVTMADEALALLILENNVKEWIEQVEKKEGEKPAKKRRLTKYTGMGRKIDGTKKGWSLEGKMRFNAIFDVVQRDRSSETSKQREENMMKDWGGERTEKDLRVRAGAVTDNDEQLALEMKRMREEDLFVPRTCIGL